MKKVKTELGSLYDESETSRFELRDIRLTQEFGVLILSLLTTTLKVHADGFKHRARG
jgi:hypothetical protein